MAFDQSTRNRLQKFVSNARAILGEEFTRQLQATYGLDPKQGTVAAIDSLTHLDNRQRQTAHLLRETLAHYLATTPGKGEKDRTKQVLDRIVREQAFTVLNRLAALRMAEARGFLLESIAKAHSSKGFQLYRQLSGTAHGETGDAYRNYLFSLFDEFSLDLAVLFDRHSAQGRLFPRESALLELLAEINHHEIEHLWAEDETIGWIYQYFNSQEERKKMRAESQAPRNSRELAVRNQFFTPRYVVEFLTDNTLGRIWYEMTQGNTALVDSCRYLVRRPTEIFLKPGEAAPEADSSNTEALSQEELLKQPVYIPHRSLKDPRCIRMLDPACGSMHFGLYAFDLFERIYLEAWQLEQQLGPDAFNREAGQQALQSTFESLEAFKQQIPKLIIEHNIHGVDIDPRAVQIAGLSLWQRAQRAWHQQGIKPQQRPTIVKSNIVCAEPMPGEKALLQEFTSKLNPPVLGQLLEVIFDKMQLAGEAGTLLKIEEEIQAAIHEAREQWLKQSGSNSVSDMFQAELDAATPQAKLGFDLSGVDDETFWDDAEQRILQALSDYADQAESNADQKRLFAEDAAKGFAFIDLCRKRFDVVLMNPPYGAPSNPCKDYLAGKYPKIWIEIYIAFSIRMQTLCHNGYIGSLTSRTWMYLQKFSSFRESILSGNYLHYLLDLGPGVLDGAAVETAAYVYSNLSAKTCYFYNLESVERNSLWFIDGNQAFCDGSKSIRPIVRDVSCYDDGLNSPIKYTEEVQLKGFLSANELFEAKPGLGTRDDFRFVRLWWEIPLVSDSKMKWCPVAFGGKSTKYFAEHRTFINWSDNGKELKEFIRMNYGSASRSIVNESYYFREGITYQYTGKTFRAQYMPEGMIISMAGQGLYPKKHNDLFSLLGILNTDFYTEELKKINPGRFFQASYVNSLSFHKEITGIFPSVSKMSEEAVVSTKELLETFESSINFNPALYLLTNADYNYATQARIQIILKAHKGIYECVKKYFKKDSLDSASRPDIQFSERNPLVLLIAAVFGRYFLPKDDLNTYEPTISGLIPSTPSVGKWIEIGETNNKEAVLTDDLDSSKCISRLVLDEFQSCCFEKIYGDFTLGDVHSYIKKSFFSDHIDLYTENKRQAPIYWPLQTPSGSYTLWVYYHRLNEQTLYTCVNDFVEPKLEQVEQDLNSLRSKSARSSQEEKELEKLSDLASELRDFRDELLRLAKFWKPNLNDGVQITAAPLWKLFQHKAWQKKLKETWESLEKGDYDWALLACSIWPERVLRKCHQDRSLAIAHDVEDYFWHEVEVPVKRGKKNTGETKPEWQPKDLNEPALLALIKQIKEERGL
ncbi:BREX-1 system adenine-specific DNA-methyltransferase PglX [Shewanella xiamenensis]|uniref:BREX-1 system adenine-specific DNA-methyltransferase PglX n=1 Tax=Shewanella xiamenensis TaxID=332186 RepID=UPI00313BCBC0